MKLTHPDVLGSSIEPKAEHVAQYQTQGWVEQAEEKPAADEKPKK